MDLLRSLPIGLYLEQPVTWLHRLDSRVKLAWLMTFLIAPILANPIWRLMLVGMLIVVTLTAAIPLRVWKQQMGLLLLFCILVFFLSAIAPDALPSEHQPRLPADELTFSQQPATLPPPPKPKPWYKPFNLGSNFPILNPKSQISNQLPQPTNYRYVLFKQGPIKITRKSLDLAINVSTLFFTVIYSTNLYLLTTASEEITAAIENLMQPLRRLHCACHRNSANLNVIFAVHSPSIGRNTKFSAIGEYPSNKLEKTRISSRRSSLVDDSRAAC